MIYASKLLGAWAPLLRGSAISQVSDEPGGNFPHSLRDVGRANSSASAAAAKIRGKLGCAQTLLSPRTDQAAFHPFTRRHYTTSRRPLLSAELRFATQRRIRAITERAPPTVPPELHPPIVAHIDTCGAAHLGGFIAIGQVQAATNTHAPDWYREHHGANITDPEILAASVKLVCVIT